MANVKDEVLENQAAELHTVSSALHCRKITSYPWAERHGGKRAVPLPYPVHLCEKTFSSAGALSDGGSRSFGLGPKGGSERALVTKCR